MSTAPTRQSILVLVHADQFIEVYGPQHIDVIVRDVPAVSTPQAEIEAERFIEATLPIKFRELLWPNLRRAMHTARRLTPESISENRISLELLRAIQEITPSTQERRRVWVS